MKTKYRKPAVTALALAISVALGLTATTTALAYESPVHVFSVHDVMGGFDGSTFGTGGAIQDLSIICDLGGTPCPADNPPVVDKSGVKLYPVDSEFGYYVVDFLGAQGKSRDKDYMEGLVGDVVENGVQIGLMVSNAATDTYKVKAPMGTWCAGLGGTFVKCETEHYTVMEHINSCHETIPYFYADPVTGEQAVLTTPPDPDDGSFLSFDCGDPNAHLDDNVEVLVDGDPAFRLTNSTPCDDVDDPEGCQMFPNDKTSTQDNVAIGSDYSVQLKDDGKPLYGWGGVHKRPNDVRMYARLQLPAAWKVEGADYVVTKAQLIVNHLITNNPNDQLRPEDLENEAATGRKPSYKIEGTPGTDTEVWKSLVPCYEGDGDLIDTEDSDPTPLAVGTYLKNMPFALDPAATPGELREDPPYAFSSDLYKGLTNAYYTTLNRDPFEWSYDQNPDPLIQDFVGSALPDDTLGELVSGPRWRLKPNKFGQDLPGLEVPLVECSPPPFQHDNIKYVVGTPVTTVINLLDWNDDEGPSPLATSKGWVDVTANDFVTVVNPGEAQPITSNGLPMTDDFDLAVYIKGDRKPTAVYNAQLVIEYEGDVPPVLGEADLRLASLTVPNRVSNQDPALRVRDLMVSACNDGPDVAAGTITLQGVSVIAGIPTVNFTHPFNALALDDCQDAVFTWTAPDGGTSITWTAEVTTVGDLEDPNADNNTMTDQTLVYPLR